MKLISPEVFQADERVVQVNAAVIDRIKQQASSVPRRRARLCVHKSTDDRLHEMLIAMARGIYIRPHKHLGKSESFHIIEGAADIVFFDEDGNVDEVLRTSAGGVFYFRNDEPRYHTQIITSDFLVVHEITNGPFNRADTVFAPWAPDETDAGAVAAYWEKLKQDVASR